MGGWSAEREVSLDSGSAVVDALRSQKIDAHTVDMERNICSILSIGKYDRVFNILHGRSGEDGEIQGLLEIIGLPYTGSGVTASAIAMDKLVSKTIWKESGLPTPQYLQIHDSSDLPEVVAELGYPFVIKPATEGSSVGVHLVRSEADFMSAWGDASQYGAVMAEQCINGREYTVAILDGKALPVIRIETPHQFYDYSAKYQSEETQYHIPSGLGDAADAFMQGLALKAFNALGCSGWGRLDFMCDESARPWLIEANTQPGMTSHSLVPKAALADGIPFAELVVRVLETSMDAVQ